MATDSKEKLNELVQSTMDSLLAKTVHIFAEAINRAIGKGWSITELTGPFESIKRHGDTYEVVYLSGKPILELHDITPTMDFSETKAKLVWKRDYRFLIPPVPLHFDD